MSVAIKSVFSERSRITQMRISDYLGFEMKKVRTKIAFNQKELDTFSSLEEGTLVYKVTNDHNFYYYLQTRTHKKQKQKYLGKLGEPVVGKYIRQRYLRELQKVLKKDERLLTRFLHDYTDYSVETIQKILPNSYKNLPKECFVDETLTELKEWAKEKYKRNPFQLPADPNIACDGTATRSKGETIAYDDTISAGLPFRFDPEIIVQGRSGVMHKLYPDFQFKCRDGSFILWEHLGMIEMNRYAERLKQKIADYLDCGYIVGLNLFFTSDNLDGNTNELMILDTIELIKKKILR